MNLMGLNMLETFPINILVTVDTRFLVIAMENIVQLLLEEEDKVHLSPL